MSKLIITTEQELSTIVNRSVTEALENAKVSKETISQTLVKKRYSRKETAKILGVSLVTLYKWTKYGLIEPCYIGSKVYYTEDAIKAAYKTSNLTNQ